MATQSITISSVAGGKSVTGTINSTIGLITLLDQESVADGQTDFQITLTLDVSAVKAFLLMSSQDVTFETNSGSSPADTIALLANVPYAWHTNDYNAFLLGTDVTAVFITNASGSTALIDLIVGADPTP
jgi:hypothetical protein